MASPFGWGWGSIPPPIQRLFDRFPLLTYGPNALPQRVAHAPTGPSLPTLYMFASDDGALAGAPSFNPVCLRWQTYLKLSGLDFHILPSTNHASPTGALPFLLPPASSAKPLAPSRAQASSPASAPSPARQPIPAGPKLRAYAATHGSTPLAPAPRPTSSSPPPPSVQPHHNASSISTTGPRPPLRLDAYRTLLDVSVRNAWLYALCLDPRGAATLDALYIRPSSASRPVRAALRHRLRRAAEAEILRHDVIHDDGGGGGGSGDHDEIMTDLGLGGWTLLGSRRGGAPAGDTGAWSSGDAGDAESRVRRRLMRGVRAALEALAALLEESSTEWFMDAHRPGEFDAEVFAYTDVMVRFMSREEGADDRGVADGHGHDADLLGVMVRQAGSGELARHRWRLLEMLWPGEAAKEGGP